MLKNLSVDNYALINSLSVTYGPGLSTITGETGAGKSILLGALGLILGQRADLGAVGDKSRKCVVEGVFDLQKYSLKDFFDQNELDYEDILIMRREITPYGKSRAFINDTPVNLTQMKELGYRLLDIHSQNTSLELGSAAFQLNAIDAFAGNIPKLNEYSSAFKKWKMQVKQVEELIEQSRRKKADEDYYNYQLDELSQARLIPGEVEELEDEISLLKNAETVKADLFYCYNSVLYSESAFLPELKRIESLLQKNADLHKGINELCTRLKSVNIELHDIADELLNIDETIDTNPKRLQQAEERIDLIYGLLTKHRCESLDELLVLQNEFTIKLEGIGSLEKEIEDLQKDIEGQEKELRKSAGSLSQRRTKVIDVFEKEIVQMLNQMGMPHAKFRIEHIKTDKLREDGVDELNFLFSANKGGSMANISSVASGGETSRIMLAVKSLIAGSVKLPTMIFDEIDAGVSGEIAGKLASILLRLSQHMQLIVITHNPQLAARGIKHYKVFKDDGGDFSQTRISLLESVEREKEIAGMLSGENFSDAALQTARELINS